MTFAEVYREHVQFVWRCLRRFAVPQGDAMDATQEVFMVVLRRLPEFEGRSERTSWLFAICYRVAGTRGRAARIRSITAAPMPAVELLDERADIGAAIERDEAIAVVHTILNDLPLEQRAVFALFELEGLSAEMIASGLGIPLGTAYSRKRLARKAFRAALRRRQAQQRSVHVRAAGMEPRE
jgi:RNA polymerase sigma-70 factor (ECF subfamily)